MTILALLALFGTTLLLITFGVFPLFKSAEAIVSERRPVRGGDGKYKVDDYVSYTVDGIPYSCRCDAGPGAYTGKPVRVFYASNPAVCEFTDQNAFLLGSVAIAISVIGFGVIWKHRDSITLP